MTFDKNVKLLIEPLIPENATKYTRKKEIYRRVYRNAGSVLHWRT